MKRALWEKVERQGDCWVWTGSAANRGYGSIHHEGRNGYLPHRLSYELLVGPIPDGLVLDHLCMNRRCVNPKHLEPVTNRVNILRGTSAAGLNSVKTHCVNGHLFDKVNTRIRKNGARICIACEKIRLQKFRESKKLKGTKR